MFSKVKTQLFLERLKQENEYHEKYVYPFTKDELQWLANELASPTAQRYFSKEELALLQAHLPSVNRNNDVFFEKGTLPENEQFSPIAVLQPLIHSILLGQKVAIDGSPHYPYRLRFSVKTNEWSVIAFEISTKMLQVLPLNHATIEMQGYFDNQEVTNLARLTEELLKQQERHVRIVVNEEHLQEAFQVEKARILNTFASYNKRIYKDKTNPNYYEIGLDYYLFEQDELLALIDQVGERVYVIAPADMKVIVKQRILKTLHQYK